MRLLVVCLVLVCCGCSRQSSLPQPDTSTSRPPDAAAKTPVALDEFDTPSQRDGHKMVTDLFATDPARNEIKFLNRERELLNRIRGTAHMAPTEDAMEKGKQADTPAK